MRVDDFEHIDEFRRTFDRFAGGHNDREIPVYADFASLDDDPPAEREWVIDQWMPMYSVIALFGGGGIGKSLLAQQIATHIANGLPIFGKAVRMGPVLGLMCEDDTDELRRRQRGVLSHLGRSPRYSSDGLHLQGRAGLENCLMTFSKDRLPLFTPLLDLIESECERLHPVLLILDNIAQLFGGVENDRYEVTAFCNALAGIAQRHRCAVLLLGHVAKAEGSEFSGSTAWEAATRTRLWLERREDGLIELHRKKANYAGRDSVVLEYQAGALVEIDGKAGGAADSLVMAQAERDVLAALDVFTARQVATSQAPTATTYLPRLASKQGLLNSTSMSNAGRALAGLIDRGDVLVGQMLGWTKTDRHVAVGLARKAAE
ncbi:MAG: AAA family ATPase [Burkholderiaceae bacterium]|nr:AAA family ATPase [Burkholderiaceae bacterium]MBP8306379.1 AAA family ATPase [Burkholderiaceae bacterium]